jgi:hypothetical protein
MFSKQSILLLLALTAAILPACFSFQSHLPLSGARRAEMRPLRCAQKPAQPQDGKDANFSDQHVDKRGVTGRFSAFAVSFTITPTCLLSSMNFVCNHNLRVDCDLCMQEIPQDSLIVMHVAHIAVWFLLLLCLFKNNNSRYL